MNVCDISSIPPLSLHSFLAVLQSVTRFEKAKTAAVPIPYMDLNIFANKKWHDFDCSKKDMQVIVEYYCTMFSVKQNMPDLQSSCGTFAESCYNAWLKTEQTVTVFTSGSTGIPKPCTHPEAHLRQELLGVVPQFLDCKRVLVTVPQHHLYGFTFGLLLPQALNVPIQSEVPFPTVIAASLQKDDLIIGIPLLFDHLCNIPELRGDTISCVGGTAPLGEGTFVKMLDKGFNFIEFFGSSESGVTCYRKKPDHPFTLLPHFMRVNPDGSLDRKLPDGSMMHSATQDNFECVDERHLLPKGRKDFAVQIGGINVFPAHIAKKMEAHPLVKHCLVRLMRPEEGTRLKTFIVPACDIVSDFSASNASSSSSSKLSAMNEKELRNELRTFMKTALSDAERPTSMTIGKELPRNLVGKPTDW